MGSQKTEKLVRNKIKITKSRAVSVLVNRVSCLVYWYTIFSHAANGLECYHCENSTSWKSCDENLKEITCVESFKRCFKANITTQNAFKNISSSVFARGCADRCDASGILHCDEHVICEAYCCSADLCNMSLKIENSKIMLFISMAALLPAGFICKWSNVAIRTLRVMTF